MTGDDNHHHQSHSRLRGSAENVTEGSESYFGRSKGAVGEAEGREEVGRPAFQVWLFEEIALLYEYVNLSTAG